MVGDPLRKKTTYFLLTARHCSRLGTMTFEIPAGGKTVLPLTVYVGIVHCWHKCEPMLIVFGNARYLMSTKWLLSLLQFSWKEEQPRVFLGFMERSWMFPDSVQSKNIGIACWQKWNDDFAMSHRHGCDSRQPQSSASNYLSSASNHRSTNFEFWLFLEITSFWYQ